MVWNNSFLGSSNDFYMINNWREWLERNLLDHNQQVEANWNLKFGVLLYLVWWRHNNVCFNSLTWSVAKVKLKASTMINAICIAEDSESAFFWE